MMKWFRTHTKQIMVALVLLAMFSFVGGSALVSLLAPNPLKEVFGRAFGQEFTHGDIQSAQRDVSILDKVSGLPSNYKTQYGEIWQFGRKDLRPEHWYLLAEEAQLAGVVVPDQELDRQMQGISADFLEDLRIKERITQSDIRASLARHVAIAKHSSHLSNAAMPSEAEVRHFVEDTEEKVRVRFVSLDADRFIDEAAPVTPEELAAQFEAHKNEDRKESESGFGYRYPPRVKMQYILASVPKVAPQLQISLDSVKAYWKANKPNYKKTIYVDPPSPASSQPASAPAEKPEPVPQVVEKSFSEARPDVERELRRRNARQIAEQAMRKVQTLLAKPWLDAKTDPDSGYKAVPLGADSPDVMREVSEQVSREFGIPLMYTETGLLSKEELMSHAELRSAGLEGEGPEMTLPEYAFRVPALDRPKAEGQTVPCLQYFQPCEAPLTASSPQFIGGKLEFVADRIIVFRVVEARPSEAPAGLDEVRAAVERDVRLARAFASIEPVAKEYDAVARRLGVEDALLLFDDLRERRGVTKAVAPAAFSRRVRVSEQLLAEKLDAGEPTVTAPAVAGIGVSPEFVDACFAMTAPGWHSDAPAIEQSQFMTAATTQPAKEPAPVIQLLPIEKLRRWFVIELMGLDAVDSDKFKTDLRKTAYLQLHGERQSVLRSDWFSPAAIEKRCGYERASELPGPGPAGNDTFQTVEPPAPPVF